MTDFHYLLLTLADHQDGRNTPDDRRVLVSMPFDLAEQRDGHVWIRTAGGADLYVDEDLDEITALIDRVESGDPGRELGDQLPPLETKTDDPLTAVMARPLEWALATRVVIADLDGFQHADLGSQMSWLEFTEKAALCTVDSSPNPSDEDVQSRWPHSRACGMRCPGHGQACHSNCPTCEGRQLLIPLVGTR